MFLFRSVCVCVCVCGCMCVVMCLSVCGYVTECVCVLCYNKYFYLFGFRSRPMALMRAVWPLCCTMKTIHWEIPSDIWSWRRKFSSFFKINYRFQLSMSSRGLTFFVVVLKHIWPLSSHGACLKYKEHDWCLVCVILQLIQVIPTVMSDLKSKGSLLSAYVVLFPVFRGVSWEIVLMLTRLHPF